MPMESLNTGSENFSISDDDSSGVGPISSFLNKYRQMPASKQQQLVSTAIVRSNGNNDPQNGLTGSSNFDNETTTREKAFEVVYGLKDKERNSKQTEPNGMCFVVDAHERQIQIISKEQQKKQPSKFIFIEDVPEKELSRFGRILSEESTSDNDRFIHCDSCDKYYDFCCLEHPFYQCQDRDPALSAPNSPSKDGEERAALTLPGILYIQNSHIPNAGKGVFAKVDIPVGVVFGPYEGILYQDAKKASQDGYAWEIRTGNGKPSYYIDAKDPRYSNWMRYINSPRHEREQNLIAFQYRGSVFYRAYRPIDKNAELLVRKEICKRIGHYKFERGIR